MIKEVTGDILLSDAQVIVHGVAPNDHFSQGLALALREAWPALYHDFRHYCHVNNPDAGGLWTWAAADGKRVVNLFTQEPSHGHKGAGHPGRAKLEYINGALRELHKLIEKEKFTSIALPRLATGVGGLEWAEVQPLIQKHLGDVKVPVTVYTTYKKGVKAAA